MELDPQLVDPICEGSIVQVGFEHRRKIDVSTIFGKCMSLQYLENVCLQYLENVCLQYL